MVGRDGGTVAIRARVAGPLATETRSGSQSCQIARKPARSRRSWRAPSERGGGCRIGRGGWLDGDCDDNDGKDRARAWDSGRAGRDNAVRLCDDAANATASLTATGNW